MRIRVTACSNDGDGGWLIEFTRADFEAPAPTTVVVLPRGDDSSGSSTLEGALNLAAGMARANFTAMEQFNEKAEAHGG
jgi:hypothetical protein